MLSTAPLSPHSFFNASSPVSTALTAFPPLWLYHDHRRLQERSMTAILVVVEPESIPMKTSLTPGFSSADGILWPDILSSHLSCSASLPNIGSSPVNVFTAEVIPTFIRSMSSDSMDTCSPFPATSAAPSAGMRLAFSGRIMSFSDRER